MNLFDTPTYRGMGGIDIWNIRATFPQFSHFIHRFHQVIHRKLSKKQGWQNPGLGFKRIKNPLKPLDKGEILDYHLVRYISNIDLRLIDVYLTVQRVTWRFRRLS
jgi:hypothetical protein